MHPAQRHALIAIITMIEQGLTQLKGIILTPTEAHVRIPEKTFQREDGYLSDDDEKDLEELMERDRLAAAKAREAKMSSILGEE